MRPQKSAGYTEGSTHSTHLPVPSTHAHKGVIRSVRTMRTSAGQSVADEPDRAHAFDAIADGPSQERVPLCPTCSWPLDGLAALVRLTEHYDCRNRRERAEHVARQQAEALKTLTDDQPPTAKSPHPGNGYEN